MTMNLQSERLNLISRSPFWAIKPDMLAAVVTGILHGQIFTHGWEAAKPTVKGNGPNKTSFIPIQGVLSKDGPGWMGSNYDAITDAAEKAGADPAVKQIVLSVDSPGGEVTGLPETAAVLAQVAKVKPVSAMVEGTAASAAYWLASQASDITLTPSGEVGSVGVRMMHVDVSKMLEDSGFKVTELYSGNFKTEWSPFKPLSDEAKEDMQNRLSAVHNDFVNAVASGRGRRASTQMQRTRMGEGRMFSAADAMGHGLADKIQSPREFYKSVTSVSQETQTGFGAQRARLALEKQRF